MTTFRAIQMDEVPQVLELIRARMAWMDVQVGSTVLERYYSERGYVAVGECTEGEYHGILRQKELQ